MVSFNTMDLKKEPDEVVVAAYRRTGDPELVGELFARYSRLTFYVCTKRLGNHDEAEDTCLEVFEKLMTLLQTTEVRNFKGWLYSVIRTACLRKARGRKTVSFSLEPLDGFDLADEEMEDEMNLRARLTDLEEALGGLEEKQQKCLRLFYYEKKTHREIAAETDYTMDQIRSYLQNGKRSLRNKLSRKASEYGGSEKQIAVD